YSIAAMTSQSGAVEERYRYAAYGDRTVLSATGTAFGTVSIVGMTRGYTGITQDPETGLLQALRRMFDPRLGCWISRDPAGYVDGLNLYAGYFVPNDVDPLGLWGPSGHFYTVFAMARLAGMSYERALTLAYYAQYADEHMSTDAVAGFI